MESVTGIGGIFIQAQDPVALAAWYATHLGLPVDSGGSAMLRWADDPQPEGDGATVWAVFAAGSPYFAPSTAPCMINYRVANLDAMLAQLREAGVPVDDRVEEYAYGRFGWATDPEGNRFELWQPIPPP